MTSAPSTHRLRTALIALVILAAIAVMTWSLFQAWSREARQRALDTFYTPPASIPREPGTVIRTEPLGVDVPGGSASRMLYVSERPDGTPAVSGAMVFVPTSPAPPEGRPVVAWAHGTVGMGDACAPSRSKNPLGDTDNWLNQMLALGWVVVATDYVGLGTPGDELYLVADAEVRDVVNSVRAVRQLPDADAGTRYVTWGHSQGGHSSLWAGHLASSYAPELELLGVAAAAPAAMLTDIMNAQWNTLVGWAIGPEVAVSWPVVERDIELAGVLTNEALRSYPRLAQECTSSNALGIELLARQGTGERFFTQNPVGVTGWRAMTEQQTPPPLPPTMPVFLAQGLSDEVVLAWPNGKLQEEWCAAGSAISAVWLGGIGHLAAATTSGPEAVQWIAGRFAGEPAPRSCQIPPPVSGPDTASGK